MQHVWGRKDEYRVLVRKPGGKKPFGMPRPKGNDNIKIYLQNV
jgi:hypothetical protein